MRTLGKTSKILVANFDLLVAQVIIGAEGTTDLATQLGSYMTTERVGRVVILGAEGRPFLSGAVPQIKRLLEQGPGQFGLRYQICLMRVPFREPADYKWLPLEYIPWGDGWAISLVYGTEKGVRRFHDALVIASQVPTI